MRVLLIAALFLTSFTFATFASDRQDHMPYSGQQTREIKALSAKKIKGYLEGSGMGMAKSAELNHYPGPKHVIELAGKLKLTGKQISATKKIFGNMKSEAVRLGGLVVEKEKGLDKLFSSRKVDAVTLRGHAKEISRLKGELRFTHLNAHLQMVTVLSQEQIKKYDELRGYSGNSAMGANGHQHHDGH